jgi:dolichyl-phosphate-mannose--protein O-mannosyl transferase
MLRTLSVLVHSRRIRYTTLVLSFRVVVIACFAAYDLVFGLIPIDHSFMRVVMR